MTRDLPDAIVVGAGINALGAAIALGEAGWRVLVLERDAIPGGAIRTLELTEPGFRHDVGAMNVSVLAGSPFWAAHAAALARKGVELVTAAHPYGSLLADGRFLGISTDRAANLASLARFASADADAWLRWSDDFDRCAPALFRMLASPPAGGGPDDVLRGAADLADDARAVLAGILRDTLRDQLGARFASDAAQSLVAAWGMHIDYAPDVPGGCWMPFLETNADERDGIRIVRGGSGRLMAALAELAGERGAELRLGSTVEEILVEDGRAAGVRLAGGECLRAARAVVASVTPTQLVDLVPGHLPDADASRARSWRYGPGTMVVHLALAGPVAWRDPAARRSFYVHVAPSLDALATVYEQAVAGLLPAEPFCVVGQPTLYDPSRAPAGRHVLWVMVRGVPATIRGDAAGEIAGRAWDPGVKQAFASRVLDLLERHAPGLRASILGMAVHGPLDLEAVDPNLVGGDLGAGSHHMDQFHGRRPLPGWGGSRTPIPGLYLCGASTWPGAGASPGSGVLAARAVLEDAG